MKILDKYTELSYHTATNDCTRNTMRKAIEIGGDEKMHVKICTAINPNDAHAIDIRYHIKYWLTHVTNVRRGTKDKEAEKCALDEAAAKNYLPL